jgi:hypothetical protein
VVKAGIFHALLSMSSASLRRRFGLKRFSALCAAGLPCSALVRRRTAAMDALLIVGGVLFIAVIGRALLNPWPSERTDEERGQLMRDIARSYF